MSEWLDLLGFDTVRSFTHTQIYRETQQEIPHFTVVARRRA